MEIASPLPFNSYSRVAKKRTFACSPSFVDSHGLSIQPSAPHEELMSDHTSYPMESENSPFITSQQVFKRRRFDSNEAVGPTVYSTPFSSPFGQSHSRPSAAVTSFGKRSRGDRDEAVVNSPPWNPEAARDEALNDLHKMVEHQASEIQRLKSEKHTAESALSNTKGALEKSNSENKILKRAVAIQQERQNQAAAELTAAYKYRVEAEDRIKKLERLNISLQYRVQSMSSNASHDFMGFQPRPPDVC